MFTGFLTVLHVIVCLVLIVVVLMQSQQSMNLSGMFGGASQSALGNRPESMLSRATTILAILFMVISVVFAIWPSSQEGGGALQSGASQPAAPAQQPAAGQQGTGSPAGEQGTQQQEAPAGGGSQSQQEQGSAQPAPSPSPES